jgi:hypothetical protein
MTTTRKKSSSHYVVKKNFSVSHLRLWEQRSKIEKIESFLKMTTKKYDADPWSKMTAEESSAVDELMKRVAGLQIPKMDLDPKLSVLGLHAHFVENHGQGFDSERARR